MAKTTLKKSAAVPVKNPSVAVKSGKPAPKPAPAAKAIAPVKAVALAKAASPSAKTAAPSKAPIPKADAKKAPVPKYVAPVAVKAAPAPAAKNGKAPPAKGSKVAAKIPVKEIPQNTIMAIPAKRGLIPPPPPPKAINGKKIKIVKEPPPPPKPVPTAVPTNERPRKNQAGLSPRDLEHFRDLLLEKRREIVGDMTSMEREALRSSGGTNLSNLPLHMADMGTDNYEQEFTLGLVEKDRVLLREINSALAKIQDGTFGTCEGTGKPISKVRLEAQPWARYSIEHAQLMERRIR